MPLAGLTVLDLTHVGAGPFCSSILGQLGADVIKVEGSDGDRMRRNRPRVGAGDIGYYFASVNAQKRFIQLDLKNAMAQEALKRVTPNVDIVVENFRPGAADRLGAGYSALSAINPGLIYCSIKGFRRDTAYADLGSIDYVHEAMTGVMSMTREPGALPPLPGYPAADFSAALYGVLSIMVALRMKDTTGKGEFIEVPLHDSLLSLLPLRLGYTIATGEDFPAFGSYHRDFVPFGVFETSDEPIVIAVATDTLWRKFVQVVPALDRPEFETMDRRLERKDAFYDELRSELLECGSKEWVARLQGVGVPAAPIMSTSAVYEDPYVQSTLRTMDVEGKPYGWLPYAPVHGSFSPTLDLPPAAAGTHTREVLESLGLSPTATQALFDAKAAE